MPIRVPKGTRIQGGQRTADTAGTKEVKILGPTDKKTTKTGGGATSTTRNTDNSPRLTDTKQVQASTPHDDEMVDDEGRAIGGGGATSTTEKNDNSPRGTENKQVQASTSHDDEMVDQEGRSIGDRNKRRSRSVSPTTKTHSRIQHQQDIRSALGGKINFLHPDASHRAAKFHGKGSPTRKAKDANLKKSDKEEEDSIEDLVNSCNLSVLGEGGESTDGSNSSNSQGVDGDPIEGVLRRTTFYLAGSFPKDLDDISDTVIANGGIIKKKLDTNTQIIITGENLSKEDVEMQQRLKTKWIPLSELQALINGKLSLGSILVTPSKVSWSESSDKHPLSYIYPCTHSSTKSSLSYPASFQTRVPRPPAKSGNSPSTPTLSTAEQSSRVSDVVARKRNTVVFKHTTIISLRVKFPQGEAPADAVPSAIGNLLTAFQGSDATTTIRHLDKDDKFFSRPEDLPTLRYMYDVCVYFNGSRPSELQPYENPKEDRKRTINCTIRVGSTAQMNQIIEDCAWTIKEVVEGGSIHLEIKPLQYVKTDCAFILIAVPIFCNSEDLSKILRKFIQEGINAAKRKKPNKYKYLPTTAPEIALMTDFVKGLPWLKEDGRGLVNAWERKPWHVMTKSEDYEDMKQCFGLLERTNNLRELFGGGAFTIDNKDDGGFGKGNRTDDEVQTLVDIVVRHTWAMKNTGQIVIRGLRKPDAPCRIRTKVTDETGRLCEEEEYYIDQNMTAREIIMRMKVNDTPVFTLIGRNKTGTFTGFYRSSYEEVKKYARRFEGDAAAYIMYWLLGRGVNDEDTLKLLQAAFTEQECEAALNTKYVNGIVVSQRTIERELRVSAFDRDNPNMDITQGMTDEEKSGHQQRVEALKDAAFKGKSNMSVGSKNNNWGSDGTVYTNKLVSLGETMFSFIGDEWESEEIDYEEDFRQMEWDEENINHMRIDTNKIHPSGTGGQHQAEGASQSSQSSNGRKKTDEDGSGEGDTPEEEQTEGEEVDNLRNSKSAGKSGSGGGDLNLKYPEDHHDKDADLAGEEKK